jgi:protease I
MMATIAVIITDMFEDSEYWKPVRAFQEAGHTVVNVGLTEGSVVTGKTEHTIVTIDRAVKDVSGDEYDALFIPGGYSPDRLRVDDEAVRFAREFMEKNRIVLSICHAPQLLITARMLMGRRLTGYKSIIQDIKNAGAQFVDAPVVEDANLISSRNPGDLPAFIEASLRRLKNGASDEVNDIEIEVMRVG